MLCYKVTWRYYVSELRLGSLVFPPNRVICLKYPFGINCDKKSQTVFSLNLGEDARNYNSWKRQTLDKLLQTSYLQQWGKWKMKDSMILWHSPTHRSAPWRWRWISHLPWYTKCNSLKSSSKQRMVYYIHLLNAVTEIVLIGHFIIYDDITYAIKLLKKLGPICMSARTLIKIEVREYGHPLGGRYRSHWLR